MFLWPSEWAWTTALHRDLLNWQLIIGPWHLVSMHIYCVAKHYHLKTWINNNVSFSLQNSHIVISYCMRERFIILMNALGKSVVAISIAPIVKPLLTYPKLRKLCNYLVCQLPWMLPFSMGTLPLKIPFCVMDLNSLLIPSSINKR